MNTRVARGIAAVVLAAAALYVTAHWHSATPVNGELFAYTLKDVNGVDVKLDDFKGKPLVVNFWATWCEPCKHETPQLQALYMKYKDQGLTIIGIETESGAADVRKFATDFKVTYPMLIGLDQQDLQTAYEFAGLLPTTVFIRRDGTIEGRAEGPRPDEFWEQHIKALF